MNSVSTEENSVKQCYVDEIQMGIFLLDYNKHMEHGAH